ncbi:WhiB family transcriptional regulator [Solicola sp. PLA-1-18]|uniref:WhiB family transcriptional regulator n=1 Tax=Solicola sp. PLA-1-18 TaxID=3380532 RepID=UPI003B8106AA
MAKLHDLQGSGESIPCVGDPRWVSDDPVAQAEAAVECGDCPALAACRRYFDAWPEPAGVWAGLTERDRDGRRANGHKRAAS